MLGAAEGPIPSPEHLQKEVFLLCEAVPKLKDLFLFEPHYKGPFSQSLYEEARDPFFNSSAYAYDSSGRLVLTVEGKRKYDSMARQYNSDARFGKVVQSMKLIRSLYDRLTRDELLLLIYVTYREYIVLSNVYDSLVRDPARRKSLADSLLEKGAITEDRHKEILTLKV